MILDPAARRELARLITRLANVGTQEVLAEPPPAIARPARRIGFTGPPGAGKSTLVGRYVERRASAGNTVAVLGIDPASPYSGGAILGDRVRMDDAAGNPRVFMRSVSSRDAFDGLCNNVADILLALDARGFDEIVMETVGVGQAEHAVKALVDTVVLLMQPETGDGIQALKAGILEVADVIVISKSDMPGAARMRENVAGTVRFGARRSAGWEVPVIGVSSEAGTGFEELEAALAKHAAWAAEHRDAAETQAMRTRYRLQDLLIRRLETVLDGLDAADVNAATPAELYDRVVGLLGR